MVVSDDITVIGNDDAGTFPSQRAVGTVVLGTIAISKYESLLADLIILNAHHRGDDLLGHFLTSQAVFGNHIAAVLTAGVLLIQRKGCGLARPGTFHIYHAGLNHRGKNAN